MKHVPLARGGRSGTAGPGDLPVAHPQVAHVSRVPERANSSGVLPVIPLKGLRSAKGALPSKEGVASPRRISPRREGSGASRRYSREDIWPSAGSDETVDSGDFASWKVLHEEKPIHRIVGRWVLGNLLGRGGFGRVYQGISAQDGSFVAVKQLLIRHKAEDGHATPSPRQESLKHEIELLRSLHHRNIVQYVDFVEIDKVKRSLNLVMEFVENGSLKGAGPAQGVCTAV